MNGFTQGMQSVRPFDRIRANGEEPPGDRRPDVSRLDYNRDTPAGHMLAGTTVGAKNFSPLAAAVNKCFARGSALGGRETQGRLSQVFQTGELILQYRSILIISRHMLTRCCRPLICSAGVCSGSMKEMTVRGLIFLKRRYRARENTYKKRACHQGPLLSALANRWMGTH